MRRGGHTIKRERRGGRSLLNMSRAYHLNLVQSDRKAHLLKGWELCTRNTGAA
jgi:hypothetical protein